jgi:predicted small lipoprotein YifL
LESAVHQPSDPLFRFCTLAVLMFALLMSGCGRKGPLDRPPGSSMPEPPANVQSGTGDNSGQQGAPPPEYSQDGRPLAPRGPKRKLPGDALID